MPRRRGYRESFGEQTSRIMVRSSMLALLLVAGAGFAMKPYLVQETLVVLLLLAVSTVAILVFSIALILSQEGIRWAVLRAKTSVVRLAGLAGLSSEAPHPTQDMSHADQ